MADDFFGTELLDQAYGRGRVQTQGNRGDPGLLKQWYNEYLGRDPEEGAHAGHIASNGYDETLRSAIYNSPEAQKYRANNPGGVEYPGTGGSVIPPDLFDIRNFLGSYLIGKLNQPNQPYPGSLEAGVDPMYGEAAGLFRNMLGQSEEGLNQAAGDISPLRSLARSPQYTDITAALDAIRAQTDMRLEDDLAGIRERYGAMGLGSGSDINEALARGASRGRADMNVAQQALIAQVMEGGRNRQLQAASALPGASTGLVQARTSAYGAAAAGLGGIAGASQSVRENNLARQYAEFVRMQQPNPYIGSAVQYATGFPPVKPAIPEGGNSWLSSVIGAGGSIAASILPFLLFSDREMKHDIQPANADDVLRSVASLPIYRWKYKGDTTPHIGPMAQDFRDTFGVGDGKTLHPIDIVGVVLASHKAMAEKFVGRGRTPEAARHA